MLPWKSFGLPGIPSLSSIMHDSGVQSYTPKVTQLFGDTAGLMCLVAQVCSCMCVHAYLRVCTRKSDVPRRSFFKHAQRHAFILVLVEIPNIGYCSSLTLMHARRYCQIHLDDAQDVATGACLPAHPSQRGPRSTRSVAKA